MSATPLLNTQASTNSNHSSINGRIEFTSFDSFIDEHLEKKQFVAHQFITSANRPDVIWGLREWLIRSAGYFDIVGYMRCPDLTHWFEYEAIAEEFDDLLLLFRDYVICQKGVDPECKYRLIRYMDNLNFILLEKKPGEIEIPTDFGYTQEEKFCSELWPELQKEFVTFQVEFEKKYGHRLDVNALFNQLCWDNNHLALLAMNLETHEE